MKRILIIVFSAISISILSGFSLFDAAKNGLKSLGNGVMGAFTGNISYLVPAQTGMIMKLRSISFVPSNTESQMASDALKWNLGELKIDNKPYFILDGSVAPELIVKVQVTQQNSGDRSFYEQRMHCPGSGYIRTCSSSEASYQQVGCRERAAILSMKVAVTRASDNVVVIDRAESKESKSKVCSDSRGSLESVEELMSRNVAEISDRVFSGQIPVVKKLPSRLLSKFEGISKADEQYLNQSNDLAEHGNLSQAMMQFNDIASHYKSTPEIYYNIAVCQQALGNFQAAKDLYMRVADSLPDLQSEISESIADIDVFISAGYSRMM